MDCIASGMTGIGIQGHSITITKIQKYLSVMDNLVEGSPPCTLPCFDENQRVQVPGTNPGVGNSLVRVIHDAGGH